MKSSATITAKIRETTLANLCMGKHPANTPLTMFPCSPETWTPFYTAFQAKYPGSIVTRAGRMGEHHDLVIQHEQNRTSLAELKVTSGNPSLLSELRWRPWSNSVQFLQGQLKSAIGQRFLGECGEQMMRAWFENEVKPFTTRHGIPLAMTYDGYSKVLFTIGMKGKQEEGATDFITRLRATPALQKELHERWLAFETTWFQTHTLDHTGLLWLVKEVIEEKDIWICVSKQGPQIIEGLEVVGLRYNGVAQKRDGGSIFQYTMLLRRGEETREVPLTYKIHWKNGGQAVQNPNFLLL